MTIVSRQLIMTILISASAIILTGCSSNISAVEDGSPNVEQAYAAAMQGKDTFAASSSDDVGGSADVTSIANRSQLPSVAMPETAQQGMVNTINAQFPTLPNPQSLMYIFGHYADGGQIPVPGHFVAFPLYTHTYYALPNEVMSPYNDGQFTVQEPS